jgi:UDP-N-acetylglucosamine 2-epimerase (non-hydrolysing)
MKKTVIHIVGARPNFIKAMPLVKVMNKLPINNLLVHTGQHYDYNMSERFFEELGIKPDYYLKAGGGSNTTQTAKIMIKCEKLFNELQPDLVVVYGDVNSTLAASLVAKKLHITVAHIESGLRSYDRDMPEELNRIVTDSISDLLFVTCDDGLDNLILEGTDTSKCWVVGNTMIDTLVTLKDKFTESHILSENKLVKNNYVLVTMHRPSNVDNTRALKSLLQSLVQISKKHQVVFPLHPRTSKNIVNFNLEGITSESDIKFIPPAGYIDFMCLQKNAKLVITDSGGVQEESSHFNTPCLTIRDNTERPVTIQNGTNKLIGTSYKNIEREIDIIDYNKKSNIKYWDGRSSERIVKILIDTLQLNK